MKYIQVDEVGMVLAVFSRKQEDPALIPITEDKIPNEKIYRGAWSYDGDVSVKMEAARISHQDKIKESSENKLKEMYVDYILADDAQKIIISSDMQTVKDLPQTFDLEQYTNANDLKNAWPTELS